MYKLMLQRWTHYIVLTLGLAAAGMTNAQAACPTGSTILSTFPAYISSSGTYCLTSHKIVNNTSNSAWAAITIAASNVTLDLGRWTINGPGYYNATVSGSGIAVTNNASNVTIRNGAIAGFQTGILLATNTGSNTVDNLTVEDMSLRGLGSAGIQVSLNSYCNNCTIQNNSISGVDANRVTTQGGYSGAYSIYMTRSTNITIRNNTITGFHSRGPLASYGIYLLYNNGAVVEGNRVANIANSPTQDTGILVFGTHNTTVNNNRLSYVYNGIKFQYSSNISHSGNTFYRVTNKIIGG